MWRSGLGVLLTLTLLLTTACGTEDDPCPSEGETVDGIQGVVVTPNCQRVSQAEVTAMHGNGDRLIITSTAEGFFAVDPSMLAEGRWVLTVEKGPFNGEMAREVEVADGQSSFIVMKLAQ